MSSGTWSLVGFESKVPVIGREALEAHVSNERMGDGRYRPLRSCLGLWLLEQTLDSFKARPKGASWASLLSAAASAAQVSLHLDVADPSLFNPPDMRAAIDAQLRRSGAKPPRDLVGYVRLIVESLGRGHADSARTFERLTGRKFKRMLIVGGGSKNSLLCQATSDASGLPVVSHALEGTAVGNLASQLIALGEISGISEFRAILSRQKRGVHYGPR